MTKQIIKKLFYSDLLDSLMKNVFEPAREEASKKENKIEICLLKYSSISELQEKIVYNHNR